MFTSAKESTKESMDNEGGAPTGAREKIRPLKEEAVHAASAVKEDLEETARKAGRHARELADSAGHDISEMGDAFVRQMRKKPFTTAAGILGAGFVLGMLIRR